MNPMPTSTRPRLHRQVRFRHQTGATTLIVVMMLFFVMSLAAAYASRNLIFEQRTSANQYRSTQSFEAAEAGLEWATALLNGGRINSSCLPSADTSFDSFRQRYLLTNVNTGVVTQRLNTSSSSAYLWAACSFDGSSWTCACPTGTLAAADLPTGRSAFAVRFVEQSGKPGMVRIEANGCNAYDLSCLRFEIPTASPFVCRSTACAMLALHSGAKAAPLAALTVRQGVTGSALAVYNSNVANGGITIHSGGAVSVAALTLGSTPGTPGAPSLRQNDSLLSTLPADSADCSYCTFSTVFGLRPETYRRQMGTLNVACGAACTATQVNTALASQRGRVVYLRGAGGLNIDDPAAAIGSATDPVVLVIEGPLVVAAGAGASARIHGLVYANSASLNGGEIRGALISATDVTGASPATVIYDGTALARLRLTSGSFVRVPGSWRDFP